MLKGTRAKVALLVTSFLVVSGVFFVVIKSSASAYSEVLTSYIDNTSPGAQYNSSTVIVDGSEDVDIDLRLVTRMDSRLYSVSGSFAQPWNEEQPYNNGYVSPSSFQSGTLPSDFQESHDINTGAFSLQCNTTDECYKIDEDSNIYSMTYTVSKDTPVGVYHMSIHIDDLQTLNNDGGIDIHEEDITFDTYIIVKRPSEITFWDENYNPITEITKRYGDEMFTVTKGVTVGDGSINSYYVESESSEEGVAYIVTGTDYIDIRSTGNARICASTSDTEYYIGTKSCYTVHIEKRPIWVLGANVPDKEYDGTTNAEVSSLSFSDRQLDESEYYIANAAFDGLNKGTRTATVEVALTELGNNRYILEEATTVAAATINPATLSDLTATITSQTYDPSVEYQIIPITVTAMFNGNEITLEEGVDYELKYGGRKMYTEIGLTEADTYEITISPKTDTSNYYFEEFSEEFTINPIVVTVQDVQVANKTYDGTNEAHISGATLNDNKLVYGMDYEAYGSLDDINVGTRNAETWVVLRNDNYKFYDDEEGTYSYYTFYDVPNVEITPMELTSENSYYVLDDKVFYYSGERIEPTISLFAYVRDGYGAEELNVSFDYEIEYPDDTINVGTKNATIVGEHNFTGSLGPIEYYISSTRPDNIEVVTPDKVYTGEALEPEPIITAVLNGNNVTFAEKDYVIDDHDSFVDAGSYNYTFTESSDGNYHFSNTESTFTILPYEISSSDISLSENVYKYNGASQTPSVTVTVGNTTISANDYDVEFSADTIGNDESDTTVTVTVRTKNNTNISGEATTTYTITPREALTISGIEDNQRVIYNGSPVVLEGNVMVEENPGGIKAEDLTVQWYASDGVTVIDRPTNAGSYKVVYSYEDADYRGALVVNFEITKAESPAPIEVETDFKIAAGQTLADLEGERTIGFNWTNSDTVVTQGNNVYTATYAYNGDAENYETLSLNIPVYGLAHVHINVVESEGGEVTVSSQEVLEGETVTITITPNSGRVLGSITINGVDYTNSVDDNTLSIAAGADDIEIASNFTSIQYSVIEGAGQIIDLDKDATAIFRIDADYGLFTGGAVYVDETLVGAENYTSWDGSTYIQLTDDYLNTLSVGEHTLMIAFGNGGTATTTFTIMRTGDGSNNKNTAAPNTGSATMISGGATAAVGLLAILLVSCVAIRKMRR